MIRRLRCWFRWQWTGYAFARDPWLTIMRLTIRDAFGDGLTCRKCGRVHL